MSDFGTELTRRMDERGVGVRQLARAVYCAPAHISNLRNGKANPSVKLAASIDAYLGANGEIKAAVPGIRPAGKPKAAGNPGQPSGAVLAIRAAMTGDPAELDIAGDGLAELVGYYARMIAIAPSDARTPSGGPGTRDTRNCSGGQR